jgi:hypothetical protein
MLKMSALICTSTKQTNGEEILNLQVLALYMKKCSNRLDCDQGGTFKYRCLQAPKQQWQGRCDMPWG